MSEKKHELILIFIALIVSCFFIIYEVFDSPKFNSVTAYEITTTQRISQETKPAKTGIININTASIDELCSLNGIGESKALAIIEYRETNGKFRSVEELTQVHGISETILNKNIDRLTI